ncbi:hypothetical protein D3C84_483840 [compost metagenome]
MTGSIGFPSGGAITFNGKPLAVVETLSKTTADASDEALGTKEEGAGKTVPGAQLQAGQRAGASESEGGGNVVVETLLKRMKELQELLQQQQEQLAAAQAASYPTPEQKATVVMGLQAQIATTSAALQQVSAALVKELSSGSSVGSQVNTTA